MITSEYKLEHEDYYVPSGLGREKVGYSRSKSSEGTCMCHELFDLEVDSYGADSMDIEEIPNIDLDSGSKFDLGK